jgi:four helix bundle protein
MKLELEQLEIYRLSETIADAIWKICEEWSWYNKHTVGGQLVRAADSIGANIADGYGRFSFREKVRFCYYARGSLMETKYFLKRAEVRGMITTTQLDKISGVVASLAPMLNAYIRSNKAQLASSKRPLSDTE